MRYAKRDLDIREKIMLSKLSKLTSYKSRSISAEIYTGEKGKGGMATEGTGASCARDLGQGWKVSPSVCIKAGETFTMADFAGPGIIKHIWMTDGAKIPRRLILRAYWDGSDTPSIEVPTNDFFACADHRKFSQVSSLAVCVNPARGFNCYWEMPFRSHCKLTIENIHTEDIYLYYQVDYVLGEVAPDAAYFHAQFRRVNPLPSKDVVTVLDNVQGKGQYVGTYLFWGVNNNGWWGEGEIKFYLDGDKDFPTICGTGTEDYFCGAYNFDVHDANDKPHYTEFTTPYSGLKTYLPDGAYQSNTRFSMYRWHITDPIYFDKDIRVTMQALGWREGGRYLPLKDDISSVSFWYQQGVCKTFPKLPDADELEII